MCVCVCACVCVCVCRRGGLEVMVHEGRHRRHVHSTLRRDFGIAFELAVEAVLGAPAFEVRHFQRESIFDIV